MTTSAGSCTEASTAAAPEALSTRAFTTDAPAYPFPLATLEAALRSPPPQQQVGVCVFHLVAHRAGTASEVLAELLGITQELVLRLIWFGAVYWSQVPPLPNRERAGALPPDQLVRIQEAHQAAVARWGKDSRLHTPRRLSADEAVTSGGYLRVHLHPKRFPAAHRLNRDGWRERILAVRPDHVVVSKPSGLQVPPTVDNVRESLLACVEEALSLTPGSLLPAHRLDAGTEGVVVLARTPAFASYFRELMSDKAQHAVRKTYKCLVTAPPPAHLLPGRGALTSVDAAPNEGSVESQGAGASGEDADGARRGPGPGPSLVHWVLEDQRRPGEMAHTEVVSEGTPGALRCELRLEQVDRVQLNAEASAMCGRESAYEVTVSLVTGRTHQVRVQMAAIGLPLLGDLLYGALASRKDAEAPSAATAPNASLQTSPLPSAAVAMPDLEAPEAVAAVAADGAATPTTAADPMPGRGAITSEADAAGVPGRAGIDATAQLQPQLHVLNVSVRGQPAEWCRPALDQQLAPIALQAHSLRVLEDGPMGPPPVEYYAGVPWWRRDQG